MQFFASFELAALFCILFPSRYHQLDGLISSTTLPYHYGYIVNVEDNFLFKDSIFIRTLFKILKLDQDGTLFEYIFYVA